MQSHTHDLTFAGTEVYKAFLTWDRGEADREWECLALLSEHAPRVAPRPLRREKRDGVPVVVMERLAGEPLGSAPLTPEQAHSLGCTLRRLYDVPQAAINAARINERLYDPTTHRQAVATWLSESHDLAGCRDPGLVSRAVDAALGWLEVPGQLPGPHLKSLGIADLNPANILWDGTTCRLVDFEDGGLTDPAYEIADHVEHIASRLPGILDCDELVAAVGLTPEEQERMQVYRRLWAAFWLAMLLPGNDGYWRNPPGSIEAQASHLLRLLG